MKDILANLDNWIAPEITGDIPKGDSPGDKIEIVEGHALKANIIFPLILQELKGLIDGGQEKIVISVCGCSGVGKSGVAALISYYLNEMGIGSYALSGDNYPRRIPKYNDAERIRVFDEGGIEALDGYLGSNEEIDFDELNEIISKFKAGVDKISLKRMGRGENDIWYEDVDFSNINVIVIDWTHGNSDFLKGVDIPIYLYSTPKDTLKFRLARNRDAAIDSPFVAMVLDLEQKKLEAQAHKAKIILSKENEIISFEELEKILR